MSDKTTMEMYGYSIDGWKATLLLYLIWLAPALVVALFMLRIKMTCG